MIVLRVRRAARASSWVVARPRSPVELRIPRASSRDRVRRRVLPSCKAFRKARGVFVVDRAVEDIKAGFDAADCDREEPALLRRIGELPMKGDGGRFSGRHHGVASLRFMIRQRCRIAWEGRTLRALPTRLPSAR